MNEEVVGIITETLPNQLFRFEYQGKEYIGYMGGKMKKARINLIVGDRVKVILDPYGGKATNRITWRL